MNLKTLTQKEKRLLETKIWFFYGFDSLEDIAPFASMGLQESWGFQFRGNGYGFWALNETLRRMEEKAMSYLDFCFAALCFKHSNGEIQIKGLFSTNPRIPHTLDFAIWCRVAQFVEDYKLEKPVKENRQNRIIAKWTLESPSKETLLADDCWGEQY